MDEILENGQTIKARIEYQEMLDKKRKELFKKVQSHKLPETLNAKSSSLTRGEHKKLKEIKVKVLTYDIEGEKTVEKTKQVPLSIEDVETYPEVKERLIDELGKLRDINLDDEEMGEIYCWLDIISARTLYPREFEGN